MACLTWCTNEVGARPGFQVNVRRCCSQKFNFSLTRTVTLLLHNFLGFVRSDTRLVSMLSTKLLPEPGCKKRYDCQPRDAWRTKTISLQHPPRGTSCRSSSSSHPLHRSPPATTPSFASSLKPAANNDPATPPILGLLPRQEPLVSFSRTHHAVKTKRDNDNENFLVAPWHGASNGCSRTDACSQNKNRSVDSRMMGHD